MLKNIRGYLVALACGLLTLGMTHLAGRYGDVLDAFYPYVTRQLLNVLAWVSSLTGFLLWQAAVYVLVAALVATLVLVIVKKWSVVRWLGWVLAAVALVWTLHTGLYGLNYYASPLEEDIRQGSYDFTKEDVKAATAYFRDRANELAKVVDRDEAGNPDFLTFENMAQTAGSGFQKLKMDGQAVFAGSTAPVKKLGWAKMYTSMGITGFTFPVTGEAAVNPQIPAVSIPFVMCHEMAHRMAIAPEDDANFTAFLACDANEDLRFQYSACYMAYRYCFNDLYAVDASAALEISGGNDPLFHRDLTYYDQFFAREQNQVATEVATTVNNAYIQASGDEAGVESYGQVATQLVNWYIENQVLPLQQPDVKFDPTDKDYIQNIIGGKI